MAKYYICIKSHTQYAWKIHKGEVFKVKEKNKNAILIANLRNNRLPYFGYYFKIRRENEFLFYDVYKELSEEEEQIIELLYG